MAVTALVMAGGKAARMRCVEKPMLQIDGVTMVQRVVNAIRSSRSVDRIVVAVTSTTSQTANKARELETEIIETPGEGYQNDMKIAIKQLRLHDVLVASADLPFMTGTMVDRAIEAYTSSGKPALSVMCPLATVRRRRMRASHVFRVDGRDLVPIGLNVIDGTRIDEPALDETVLVTECGDLALNVNTPDELQVARELSKQRNLRGLLYDK